MTTRYIAETRWKVQLQTGAPTLQTFEKVLDAPSDQMAIHRAQAMYPNVQFVSVTATQVDQQGGPSQQQNANTPNGTGMLPGFKPLQPLKALAPPWPQNQQAAESALPFNVRRFFFPYSISLPMQFERLLMETAPVTVIKHDGHRSIVLETEKQMQDFLTRLTSNRDRRAVDAVIAGIRSSLG